MKNCTATFMLQLINGAYGSKLTHVSVKFSAVKAEQFKRHPKFQQIENQLWTATNNAGQTWFYLQGIATPERGIFAQIMADINLGDKVNKLEKRAKKLRDKASELTMQRNYLLGFDPDELPF